MTFIPLSPQRPHLMWVYTGSPNESLDAATWLDTTAELRKLGWRVTLVVVGPAGLQSVRGVEVFGIPKSDTYLLRQFSFHLQFLRFLIAQWSSVDVVLFHSMSAPWVWPLWLARQMWRQQRPLLVMDTRTVPMAPPENETQRDRMRRHYHVLMEHLANHWADGRLAITPHMAGAVGIPPAKLWGVWPSGVNLDRLAAAGVARRWPVPGEPIHLVYIGVLHYERNLLTFSRAVEQANAEGMHFGFSMVGDGTQRAELEQFAAQTAGRVRVIPPVPHDQVGSVLAAAHVGVLPFPDEEKFRVSSPIKLFEYMAAGLPILATRITCHTDVIGAGSYVIWAEQGDVAGLLDALRQVWAQRAALSQLGKQATGAARDWTWQASARKLKDSLEEGLTRVIQPV